jgi:hypothetical protein
MRAILKGFMSLKELEIYTNLDGYEMASSILAALSDAMSYCRENDIDIHIWHNDMLHGKAYLLYRDRTENGFIISSANFTKNGLVNNHEFGVFIDNKMLQQEMMGRINEINFSELSEKQVAYLLEKAKGFERDNATHDKAPVFKASDHFDIRPSIKTESRCRYYLKPLGSVERPVYEGYTIIADNELGLSKKNKNISKGDIFICHGVGPSKILGYCQVMTDRPVIREDDPDDRWIYKYPTMCISKEYSSHWWEYDLRTLDLVEEFVSKKGEGIHVTAAGGDTLGGLKWGAQIIELSKEFAGFVIDKMLAVKDEG